MSRSVELKKMWISLLQFLVVLTFIDISLGLGVKHIFFSQETGKYARIIHSIEKDSSDIIIMGSSHANRHYVPKIFENNLNLSCYNCGVQGQKLIFHSTLQQIMLSKSKPKIIILDIDSHWLYEDDEAFQRLADLHPFYWKYRDIIQPVLSSNSNFTDFKLLPYSYRFNSTLVHAIKYWILPQPDYNGYRPLYGKMSSTKESKKDTNNDEQVFEKEIDVVFVSALNNFILETQRNNIDLYFVLSPKPYLSDLSDSKSFQLINQMALEKGVWLLNFTNNPSFTEKYELFNDTGHLNHKGATLFSRLVSLEIDSIRKNARIHKILYK